MTTNKYLIHAWLERVQADTTCVCGQGRVEYRMQLFYSYDDGNEETLGEDARRYMCEHQVDGRAEPVRVAGVCLQCAKFSSIAFTSEMEAVAAIQFSYETNHPVAFVRNSDNDSMIAIAPRGSTIDDLVKKLEYGGEDVHFVGRE